MSVPNKNVCTHRLAEAGLGGDGGRVEEGREELGV